MNKEKIKSIMLIVLTIVIICLIACMVFSPKKVRYKYYDNDLIEINNLTKFQTQANITANNALAIILESNEKNTYYGKIEVKMYNEEGKEISKETKEQLILPKNGTIYSFKLANLNDHYAGKIKIKITKEKVASQNNVDISQINYNVKKTFVENNNTHINFELINNTNTKINHLTGHVVAQYKDQIVDFTSFDIDDFDIDIKKEQEIIFPAYEFSGELQKIKYDNLKVFIIAVN